MAKAKAKSKSVAVVAHSGKKLGDGLGELRRVLADAGYRDPIWYEVPNTRKAPRAVHRAVKKGAKLIFVWGGDGMVQRCIDALAGSKKVELAILPAGTANLLATNLRIPKDIAKAVRIGLQGNRRKLDVGVINGERFAVMAGTGLDGIVMRDVDGATKRRLGRVAYIRSGVKAMQAKSVAMTVRVDGAVWFKGKASLVLIGNVGTVTGGLVVFPDASPSNGTLDVAVVTASSTWQWVRVLSRVASGHLARSPFVEVTRGKKIVIELARKIPYELDGGARPPEKRLKVRVKAGAITLCVPAARASARPPRTRARIPGPRRASPSTSRPPTPAVNPVAPHDDPAPPHADAADPALPAPAGP
jgi:YegS/Rv2252/BmrU family lipid kinase